MSKAITIKLGASVLALAMGASGVLADYTAFPTAGSSNYSTNDNTADGSGIENVVTVTGKYIVDNVEISAPVDNAFANVDVVTANADIKVEKEASKTTGAAVGDTITYTYTVTNNGNVTLNDVRLSDRHISASDKTVNITNCSLDTAGTATTTITTDAVNGDVIGPFAPNAIVECSFQYTVTQADVDQLQASSQ